jgi:hypothetical protein
MYPFYIFNMFVKLRSAAVSTSYMYRWRVVLNLVLEKFKRIEYCPFG